MDKRGQPVNLADHIGRKHIAIDLDSNFLFQLRDTVHVHRLFVIKVERKFILKVSYIFQTLPIYLP